MMATRTPATPAMLVSSVPVWGSGSPVKKSLAKGGTVAVWQKGAVACTLAQAAAVVHA